MTTTHCQQFVDIEKVHRALTLLKALGNEFYQHIPANLKNYRERCQNEDPEGFHLLFGNGDDHNNNSNDRNIPVDDDNDTAKSDSDDNSKAKINCATDSDDEDKTFRENDPVKRQQFDKGLSI